MKNSNITYSIFETVLFYRTVFHFTYMWFLQFKINFIVVSSKKVNKLRKQAHLKLAKYYHLLL